MFDFYAKKTLSFQEGKFGAKSRKRKTDNRYEQVIFLIGRRSFDILKNAPVRVK